MANGDEGRRRGAREGDCGGRGIAVEGGEGRRWRAAREGGGGAEGARYFWPDGYGLGPRVAYNKSSRVYINRACDCFWMVRHDVTPGFGL